MTTLREFKAGLDKRMTDPFARPFACHGSPLECTTLIVGFNAATKLEKPFSSYWSDTAGFLWDEFTVDYDNTRSRAGNRPVIEAISGEFGALFGDQPVLGAVAQGEGPAPRGSESRSPRVPLSGNSAEIGYSSQ